MIGRPLLVGPAVILGLAGPRIPNRKARVAALGGAVDRHADFVPNQWIGGHPRTARINYETMLDGDRLSLAARRDIGEVLGVKLSPDAAAGTVKLAPPLRQLVENVDEVLERLAGTPFAWLRLLHGARS